jgi:tetratricopeptide (TPR) repeat protein
MAGIAAAALLALLAGCAGQFQQLEAELRLHNQQYPEAIALLRETLAADPGNCPARAKLGFALYRSGQMDAAIGEFQQVLAVRPGDPLATLYLGMAYAATDQVGRALEVWQGYTNPGKPLVEAEIRRQVTLVQIAYSHKLAQAALTQEKALGAASAEPGTVAVCYFADLTPDRRLAAFQKGLAAMVAADLGKVKTLKVIERLRLQALLAEMQLGQTGIVDPQSAPRVGRLLGAEKLMVGSLAGGSIQTAMSLTSSTRAAVLGSSQMTVATEDFYRLPAGLIRAAADIAGIVLSPAEAAAIGIPHTRSLKAFTYYGQGLDALDAGRYAAARNLFFLAVEEDPEFDLARRALEGTPGDDAPSPAALAATPLAQVIAQFETAVSQAEAAQSAANAEAEEVEAASGGGGY